MGRSFEHFESAGFTTATLWVFEENHGSRRFYERLGWAASSTYHLFERDGYRIPEIRYHRTF
jgi:RimJ/RimL family protein N-acetyltransferase